MEKEGLQANLEKVLDEMQIQTGKQPDEPPGFCKRIVGGALTGTPFDAWGAPWQSRERKDLPVDIPTDPVILRGGATIEDALVELLPQTDTVEAVLASGKLKDGVTRHIVALVPIEGAVHIVDSLEPGVLGTYPDANAATEHLNERFRVDSISLHVFPTEKVRESRSSLKRIERAQPINIGEGAPNSRWQNNLTPDLSDVYQSLIK